MSRGGHKPSAQFRFLFSSDCVACTYIMTAVQADMNVPATKSFKLRYELNHESYMTCGTSEKHCGSIEKEDQQVTLPF